MAFSNLEKKVIHRYPIPKGMAWEQFPNMTRPDSREVLDAMYVWLNDPSTKQSLQNAMPPHLLPSMDNFSLAYFLGISATHEAAKMVLAANGNGN